MTNHEYKTKLREVIEKTLIATGEFNFGYAETNEAVSAMLAAVEAVSHPDSVRLDWLENQSVNVRAPLLFGSRELFHAAPARGDDYESPSDIRGMIDAIQSEKIKK